MFGYGTRLSNSTDEARVGQTDAPTATVGEPNPCDPFQPKMPNFDIGRRKSDAKCLEYIWELKKRDDFKKHVKACNEYQIKQGVVLNGPLVLGGRKTLPGEFPHMGALGWRAVIGTWLFKCGSSLISPKFLLTAAHCSKISSIDTTVADTRPEIVRLGDKNIKDDFSNGRSPIDVKIHKITVHPQYNSPETYNDIAIVELVNEVNFDKFLQPACLWSKHDTSPLGKTASVTGWGFIDSAKLTTPPELQVASVNIIDSKQCNDLLAPSFNRHFCGVRSSQICAGVLSGGIDSCQGDSGGPLQVKISLPITTEGSLSHVIGVTSFGFGCGRVNKTGVYTRVSSYVDWIESIVWP